MVDTPTLKEKILDYLKDHPGARIIEIKEAVNTTYGSAQSYLTLLSKQAMIVSTGHGRYALSQTGAQSLTNKTAERLELQKKIAAPNLRFVSNKKQLDAGRIHNLWDSMLHLVEEYGLEECDQVFSRIKKLKGK